MIQREHSFMNATTVKMNWGNGSICRMHVGTKKKEKKKQNNARSIKMCNSLSFFFLFHWWTSTNPWHAWEGMCTLVVVVFGGSSILPCDCQSLSPICLLLGWLMVGSPSMGVPEWKERQMPWFHCETLNLRDWKENTCRNGKKKWFPSKWSTKLI